MFKWNRISLKQTEFASYVNFYVSGPVCFFSSGKVNESFAWILSNHSKSLLMLALQASSMNDLFVACYLSEREFSLVLHKGL